MNQGAIVPQGGRFGRPQGLLGWVVGQAMTIINGPANRVAVELLDVGPRDQVLEIGFGPGKSIAHLASRASAGFVAGVDLSDVMVKAATRKNEAFIRRGLVELRQGTVSHLPYEVGRFTRALAVNSFQFWPSPADDLREVRRVLRPGGLLVLVLPLKVPKRILSRQGLSADDMSALQALLEGAGFLHVRAEVRNWPWLSEAFVLAQC